jgi:2-polyprenyl-3-methyl-5-hydroxy-6-metoxy-1,4-benzoquinol methylase
MNFTGERIVEGITPQRIWLDHLSRYEFAANKVNERIVLDIACGTGYGSKLLIDAGAKEVIGIDINRDTINYASDKYRNKGLQFHVGDITKIDYKNNYFDIITCFETIEHVKDSNKVLVELRRVLKPSGQIIISTPNRKLTSPGKSIDEPPNNNHHEIEYTTCEFIHMLKKIFRVLELFGQRKVLKLFTSNFFRKIFYHVWSDIYSPERGKSTLEKISPYFEYRYVIAVCKR